MSIWYINKQGIALNEGGKWVTFCFIRTWYDYRWLLRLWAFGCELICMDVIIRRPHEKELQREEVECEKAIAKNVKEMAEFRERVLKIAEEWQCPK